MGAVFSAMKTEYVVVMEQAHPLGPAYSIPPYISFIMGLRMLLLHALIPCLAAYILPSSPVLYCTCFSTFWHCHPYILQHFNGNVFLPFIILLEEVKLNNHKINELESLHVEIYHYVLGNRGIIFC